MKIEFYEYMHFRDVEYYAGRYTTQRFGQAFCNQYNITDSTLFYMTDLKKCWEYIEDEYVDWEMKT